MILFSDTMQLRRITPRGQMHNECHLIVKRVSDFCKMLRWTYRYRHRIRGDDITGTACGKYELCSEHHVRRGLVAESLPVVT